LTTAISKCDFICIAIKIWLSMLPSVAIAMQVKTPSLDKEADPMAGLMGLMKV